MHEPPHSATMPSTPWRMAACMMLVPTSISSVVSFPSWLIYVTRGMVVVVLGQVYGGPALRNLRAGVEHFSSDVFARRLRVYRDDKQPMREAGDEGRIARIRCRHPCRADRGSPRHIRRSRLPPAPWRVGAIPPAGQDRCAGRGARPPCLPLWPDIL